MHSHNKSPHTKPFANRGGFQALRPVHRRSLDYRYLVWSGHPRKGTLPGLALNGAAETQLGHKDTGRRTRQRIQYHQTNPSDFPLGVNLGFKSYAAINTHDMTHTSCMSLCPLQSRLIKTTHPISR